MPKSRRFEFIDATSNKFWEVSVAAATVTVHYGRIGTDGQTQIKAYDSPAEAKAAAEKQIAEKVKKGYHEVGAGKTAQPAATAKTPAKKAPAKKAPAKKAPAPNVLTEQPDAPTPASVGIAGKSFLFTGTLTTLTRAEAEQQVKAQGGTVLASVSDALDYLVVGEKAGSKLAKAKKIPSITVLSEDQFQELCGRAVSLRIPFHGDATSVLGFDQPGTATDFSPLAELGEVYRRTKIGQQLFGGIVYFETDTYYYVVAGEKDEFLGSPEKREKWPCSSNGEGDRIGEYTDWELPSIRELELMHRYLWIDRPELSFCDFSEDFYWSGEKYEDLDRVNDDGEEETDWGDWVPYQGFNYGGPRATAPSIEEYEGDLTRLRTQPFDYESSGRDEYSGASEMYVRLVRKERKSQAIEMGMRIDKKHRQQWSPLSKEVRHTLKYITNPWDTYEGERERQRESSPNKNKASSTVAKKK